MVGRGGGFNATQQIRDCESFEQCTKQSKATSRQIIKCPEPPGAGSLACIVSHVIQHPPHSSALEIGSLAGIPDAAPITSCWFIQTCCSFVHTSPTCLRAPTELTCSKDMLDWKSLAIVASTVRRQRVESNTGCFIVSQTPRNLQ